MKKRKSKAGRKPKPENEKKFRVVTMVSEIDIAQDNGVRCYLKAMNQEMDKRIKSKKK